MKLLLISLYFISSVCLANNQVFCTTIGTITNCNQYHSDGQVTNTQINQYGDLSVGTTYEFGGNNPDGTNLPRGNDQ